MKTIREKISDGLLLKSAAETHAAGMQIGKDIEPNQTITLSGNLGDGKTTLSKGIAAGWGVSSTVKSPTFNYFLTYQGTRGLLVHLDAYRLSGADEYDSLLLEEILEEPWLLLVEWPDKIEGCLPHPRIALQLKTVDDATRRLSYQSPTKPN